MSGPNLLSLSRAALAGPVAWAIVSDRPAAAFALLLVALATDFLDGRLARRSDRRTELGRILDPVADKVLAAAILVALLATGRLPLELVVVIVLRDLVLLAFGWVTVRAHGSVPAASVPGKIAFGILGVYLAGEVAGLGWPDWAPAFVGASYVLGAVGYLRRIPGVGFGRVAKGER